MQGKDKTGERKMTDPLKHLFDTIPIVFTESNEDERKRLGLGEEEDKGQFSNITKRGRIKYDAEK